MPTSMDVHHSAHIIVTIHYMACILLFLFRALFFSVVVIVLLLLLFVVSGRLGTLGILSCFRMHTLTSRSASICRLGLRDITRGGALYA